MENESQRYDAVISKAQVRLQNVGFDPMLIILIIQIIMAVINFCLKNREKPAFSMMGKLRLSKALRKEKEITDWRDALDKIEKAFEGVSEADVKDFCDASKTFCCQE